MGTEAEVELEMLSRDQTDGSPSKPPVRIGLVGCGRLAEFGYIPAFRRASGVALVGVADTNPLRCKQIAPELPAYNTIQELIEAGAVEAVIISTPTRCHLADAVAAAQAKLPVLLEKPPGIDLSEAEALLDLVPRPWIAFNRRFDPDLVRLRSNVPRDGMLEVRLELHYRRKAWKPFDMQDDALLDLGPHLIDLARWLSKSEVRSARTLSLKEQCAEFELELTRGRAAVVCSTNRPYREWMKITDADGRLCASHRRGGIVSGIMARLRPKGENPLVSSLVGQLEALGRAVRGVGERPRLASPAEGIAVMSAIEAVRRSAASRGSRVSVT
jgi:predicted dehydrogenase